MAKQKFEIATFTQGINGSASETDIDRNAASFSNNIDAVAEDGVLRGIKEDTVFSKNLSFNTPSKHIVTLAFNAAGNDTTSHAIASMASADDDFIQINTSSAHGLITGDVIKLTGTAGSDPDIIDGYHKITLVDSDSFIIEEDFSDNVTAGLITDGTFVKCYVQSVGPRSLQWGGTFFTLNSITGSETSDTIEEKNYYFWYSYNSIGTDPGSGNTDFEGFTGVEIALGSGAKTTEDIATATANAISSQSNLSVMRSTRYVQITCDVKGKCDLVPSQPDTMEFERTDTFLSLVSNSVTAVITQQGQGTVFKSDDMTIFKDDSDKYNIFSIDYSTNKLFRLTDIYGDSNLGEFSSNIIHNNLSTFKTRDKNIHLGLGSGEQFKTKWIGHIDRNQLGNNYNDYYIENDELAPLSESYAPMNFDVIASNQLHDNKVAFNELQSYHSEVTMNAGQTLQVAFQSGVLYADGAANFNLHGKAANVVPQIGWCFSISNTNDTSDAKLLAAKKAYYENDAGETALVAKDIFMVVDNVAGSEVLEYIGNATSGIPAFFIGATEGSNLVYKVSTSYDTDTDASFATGKRYSILDLTSVLDDSGIMTIAPCRSPLTSGYTSGKSKYICYGDGTIDKRHIADQRSRALHMVYWISTVQGNFYRVNLMDYHSLNSDDDYKGPKRDALMTLDYSQIGKTQDSTYDGKFKHWFGGIYGTERFELDTDSDNDYVSGSSAFTATNWVDTYETTWSREPVNSNIVGIIETWNNSTEGNSSAAENNAAARYVYDDDSNVAGGGDHHYPASGYTDHHHARKHGSKDFWDIATDKTMNITNQNHGVDVGNILTGFILGDDSGGHLDYEGNTICNKVRGIDDFQVMATHDSSGGASDEFPYYSCKVWVLFRRKDNSSFSRWDLMLYNFYPTMVDTNNSATMYDRTPPYDEVDKAPHPNQKERHTNSVASDLWFSYEHSGASEPYALMQKSSQVLGDTDQLKPQNYVYPGDSISYSAMRWGVQRRDGSAVSHNIGFDSLPNFDFGRIIGWDGTDNLDDVRKVLPEKHTLSNVYVQDERPSNYHQMTKTDTPVDSDWNKTGNKHQVCFVGKTNGKLALEGNSAYHRSTEGTWHIQMHTGKFASYSSKNILFRVTDNGCAVQDTRTWAGHYEADSSINQIIPFHYAAGGRFKKRCIIKTDGTLKSIRGSGDNGNGVSNFYLGDNYSLYDGSRVTDATIPLSNGSSTMYAGQIGDYLYIDRKWLSGEPQVGTTNIRANKLGAYCVETYHGNNESYYKFDGQMRHYNSSGQMITDIRGNRGYYSQQSNGLTSANNSPHSNGSQGHEMSSRSQNMFMTRVFGVHDVDDSSSQSGSENFLTGHTNTENNYGKNNTHISSDSTKAFDINRYAPAFEICMNHAFEMRQIDSEHGQYDLVRSVQNLYNNNLTYDNELLMSSKIITDGENSSVITSQSIDYRNTGTTETMSDSYQSSTVHQPLDLMSKEVEQNYSTYTKLLPKALTSNEDIAANNAYGSLWANGTVKPATGTSASQFVAPFAENTGGYDFNDDNIQDPKSLTADGYTVLSSLLSVTGLTAGSTEFPASSNIKYKISLLYDGYQESPLSTFFYDIDISSTAYEYGTVNIKLLNTDLLSKRVSHIVIYRKNTNNDLYRMVKQLELDAKDWGLDSDGNYIRSFRDDKRFSSYTALTGISEDITNTSLNYEMSTVLDDTLFVAKAYHPEIDDSSKYIFKSKPGNFSQFDYTKDYLVLDSKPVAIESFAGKIWAFDRSNIYRINPTQMFVEDKFEGVGCLNKDSICVTEFGMCFADKNNVYLHDGTRSTPIANNILSISTYEGIDIGWQESVKISEDTVNIDPFIFYDGQSNSFVCFVYGVSDTDYSTNIPMAWVYNISRNRWDYWEAPKVLKAVQGKDGDILIANNSYLYNYKKDTTSRDWKWLSKKLSITNITNDKRFHRISTLGSTILSTISTPPKWNDDMAVYVDGDLQQLTVLTNKHVKSFTGGFVSATISDSATSFTLKGKNANTSKIEGLVPPVNSYIMIEDEIMLVTAVSGFTLTVTRAQLGTTAVEHVFDSSTGSTTGLEGQRIFNIAPVIKLPSKCKGKNIQVMLQNQKGVVDSIMIDFIDKRTR